MATPEASSWRSLVPPESRALTRRYVEDFLQRSLTRCSPKDVDKIPVIACKFEETVWAEARSHREYEEKIQRKLQRVDDSKHGLGAPPNQHNQRQHNQGQHNQHQHQPAN